MTSRRWGGAALSTLLAVTAVVWWRVAPGTGQDHSRAFRTRYEPRCAGLPSMPGARTAVYRLGSPYRTSDRFTRDDILTVYFSGTSGLNGRTVELEERVGSRWVPKYFANLERGELLVARLFKVNTPYPFGVAPHGPPEPPPLSAISFPVTVEPGMWRACFIAGNGARGGNVFANFTVRARE